MHLMCDFYSFCAKFSAKEYTKVPSFEIEKFNIFWGGALTFRLFAHQIGGHPSPNPRPVSAFCASVLRPWAIELVPTLK